LANDESAPLLVYVSGSSISLCASRNGSVKALSPQ